MSDTGDFDITPQDYHGRIKVASSCTPFWIYRTIPIQNGKNEDKLCLYYDLIPVSGQSNQAR